MESQTLMGGGDGPTNNGSYNTLPKAGVIGPKYTQKTVLGQVRNWKRFSWLEWTFVAVASISILLILAISIERFVTFEKEFKNITYRDNATMPYECSKWTCTNDFIFTVVLILNIIFSALYALDGLLRERMFSLVGYGATIIIIMLYVIANYGIKSERKQLTDPLRLARLIAILIGGPINIILSSLISWKMGYFIFTTVGGNTTLIRAYKIRSFLVTLHVLLLQVMANVLALSWSRNGLYIPIGEEVVVCLLLIHCVVVIVLGWGTVMFEKDLLVPVWYFFLAPYVAYFVYKLVNVAVNFGSRYAVKVTMYNHSGITVVNTDFNYIGITLLFGCIMGLVIVALMFVFMALTLRNFKKGLKDKAPPLTDEWQGLWQRLPTRLGRKPSPSPLA